MAQLKDLLVNGSARVIGSLFANLSGNVLNFGVCSTAAATAAKTVTTNGTFELITGSKILVLFSETDSSNAPTLNVNGTGAKSIKINASDGIGKGFLVAQQYYWFVYDGTNWRTAGAGITQIIPTQYGGTGNSSYTANRPLFYNGTRIIDSTTNYINDTQLAINKTSITSGYNFEVNGNSNLIGSVTVGTSTSGALGIAQTDGAGRGISLYNGPTSAMPDYGIAFAKTATFGTHGAVTSDWATYFTMSNTTTRGWIFRRGSTNVASIDGTGKLYLGYAASAANPGIYWNPYVESASDGSDVSAIYQIKSGVAGGTELRISQANDATDVINIVSPQFIYLNSKKTFRINDAWLRINEDKGFSSGIYTGSSLVRTDNQFQVGDSGNKFYANSSGNGYFSNTLGIGGTNTSYKLYVNGTSLHTNTININPNTVAIDFRYNDDRLHSTISYQTSGNEALVFANKYACASFLFITNEDSVTNHGSDRWNSLTSAGLQIKENCVQIGGLWGNNVHPDYKLKVNGTSRFDGNLTLYSASEDSPGLIFHRDDTSLTDWRIYVTGGQLSFASATDASTWTRRAYFLDGSGTFVPNTTNTYDLGSSSLRWKNIYATTLNGNLAKKLTIQANGIQKGQFNNSADVTINLGNVVQDFTGANSGNAANINADTFAGMTRQQWLNTVYPVGSIYMSVSATSPAMLFGGKWEQLKDRFLLSAGDTYVAGSTGGEAQHTLTVDEMPSHSHNFDNYIDGYTNVNSRAGIGNFITPIINLLDPNDTIGAGQYTNAAGNSKPHNNMPPYLVVYMWKRTA